MVIPLADLSLFYKDSIILLAGAVIAAPIFKRIGLGTVLGYLAAGIVIGPIFGIIAGGEEILHFSEIGIILLLFVIGLELKPSRLWSMKRDIFGLGATQVASCGVMLSLVAYALLQNVAIALTLGFGLALSSTAFALQMLESAGDMNTLYGRKSFSILLFQDLAIIPLLALIPLLAGSGETGNSFQSFIEGLCAILIVWAVGRYLLDPLFRLIARTGAREAMIAAALLVVLGAAGLMALAGLSMALGSFLAGVMLAESSYRHELEADIEPFRGLFLGLFFLAIGLSLDVKVVLEYWMVILLCAPILMAIKALLIYVSARLFGNGHPESVKIAAVIPQSGEFGFVLFAAAASVGILNADQSSIVICMVVLSMALTPLTVKLGDLILSRRLKEEMEEDYSDAGSRVLVVGFSRMGQVATQSLLAAGHEITMIDNNPDQVKAAADFGFKIYFGDGTRKAVLLAAGIEETDIVAVCTHSKSITTKIVELIKSEFPSTKIYARAYDRGHALELIEKGAHYQIRETFESAMSLGQNLLVGLGHGSEEAEDIISQIRKLDVERLSAQQIEGMYAGQHLLHTAPVKPEPLVEPKFDAEGLDKRSQKILEENKESE